MSIWLWLSDDDDDNDEMVDDEQVQGGPEVDDNTADDGHNKRPRWTATGEVELPTLRCAIQ